MSDLPIDETAILGALASLHNTTIRVTYELLLPSELDATSYLGMPVHDNCEFVPKGMFYIVPLGTLKLWRESLTGEADDE